MEASTTNLPPNSPASATGAAASKITIEEKLERHKSGSTVDEWEILRHRPDVGSSSG
ncbi:hypothetical protein CH063_15264, partial [Colletotrichum higginsianum]